MLIRLRVLHPMLAVLSGVYLSSMGWLLGRVRPGSTQNPWSRMLGALVLIQLVAGLTNLLLLGGHIGRPNAGPSAAFQCNSSKNSRSLLPIS